MKKIQRVFGIAIFLMASSVYALSLGQVSDNVLKPISYLSQGFNYISWIVGAGVFISSLIQYRMHKKNPVQVRMSKVWMLFFLGLFLIALPFIGMLSGVQFVPIVHH